LTDTTVDDLGLGKINHKCLFQPTLYVVQTDRITCIYHCVMPFLPNSIAEGRTLNCRLSLVAINVAEFRLLLSALHYNENADRKQAVILYLVAAFSTYDTLDRRYTESYTAVKWSLLAGFRVNVAYGR